MSYIKRILIGCLILVFVGLSLQGKSQVLIVSGKGKIANAAYWIPYGDSGKINYLFISGEESFVLPQVKPRTKEIRILINHKSIEFGNLKLDGKSFVVTIKYDNDGNITEINKHEYGSNNNGEFASVKYKYENGRVVGWTQGDLNSHPFYSNESKYSYNKQGFLEKQYYRHGQLGTTLFEYKTDSKGNILSAKQYDYAGKVINDSDESYQYDSKGRLVNYKSNVFKKGKYYNEDYSRNIDKMWHYDNKGNMTSLKIKDRIKISFYNYEYKDFDNEYIFEYGKDGNPTQLIHYEHNDITVIVEGWDYTFTYTFYPDPKEQEREEALNKREQIRRDSIQLVTKRKNDSINLEKQRKESLRQERKKELFQVCRFLFDSDEEYELCVVKQNDLVEHEIKSRVVKKLQYIYPSVLEGKELRNEKQPGRNELIQICNMCNQLSNLKARCGSEEVEIINQICDYTESKLGDFVSGRSALSKAYKKTSNKSYSSFLLSYMNDK